MLLHVTDSYFCMFFEELEVNLTMVALTLSYGVEA
jgi:hypothetical protein